MPIVLPDSNDATTFFITGKPVPQKTSEWMKLLVIALSYVALRDPFENSMFYHASLPTKYYDEQTDEEGESLGAAALFQPLAPAYSSRVGLHAPVEASALLILHPAGVQVSPDLEEPESLPVAVGGLLLPGLPELGFDHRAAWAAVAIDGSVAGMTYTSHARLNDDQDLAALGALLSSG